MSTGAGMEAQARFHRHVALLFAMTVPLMAVIGFAHVPVFDASVLVRLVVPLGLAAWSLKVARSDQPDALPVVLAVLAYITTAVLLEAALDTDLANLDATTAFGLVMLIAVLAGTLAVGNRVVWTGGLIVAVSGWVIAVGLFLEEPIGVVVSRALAAAAGIVFTTTLVGQLYDRLNAAIHAYRRSRRLQDAVARCSEALLVQSDTSALQEAVSAIFEATAADYAYVDHTLEIEGGPGWQIVAEATRSAERYGDWKTGRYTLTPTVYRQLVRGEAVVLHTRDLEGRERSLYEADGILSELCVPIFVEREFRGSVGFVLYTEEREWSEEEVQTLWRAADMIGAYWQRRDDAAALEASNESKDRLLASVSHEIRTPLTAIVGLSEEIVSNRSLGSNEMIELIEIIADQSRELAELVEDLLVASRADFGNLSIRPEEIDLGQQVSQVIEGLGKSNMEGKSVRLSDAGLAAWADPLRVRQIIRNLVSNAVKYGGDRIEVDVGERSGLATVVVTDNGPGVPQAESNLIFERYYRSAQSPTQPGSVGIGLAVSRQLAEMMGGALAYVADEDGHRFELCLPAVSQIVPTRVSQPA